jgi:Tfp pilus assembly protein PilF
MIHPMLRTLFFVLVGQLVLGSLAPAADSVGEKPPWQRLLQGADAKKASELQACVTRLEEAEKWDEAVQAAEELLELRKQAQGTDHWQTINARSQLEALRAAMRQTKELQKLYAGVPALERKANLWEALGRHREAQPLLENVLDISRKVLGEEHADTAICRGKLAVNLVAQGKHAAAEVELRKALNILRRVLGEAHPSTATSYMALALNLNAQSKYVAAEDGFRKALDISRKVRGEEHPDTAQCYMGLALNLQAQGRYPEGEKSLRKALDIGRKLFGEEHLSTSQGYNNLGMNLNAQGKYGAAEEFLRKALEIRRKFLGEQHPSTATCFDNLGTNLIAQGKYGAAEEHLSKALEIRRKRLGEEHPDTGLSYNNLAANQKAQGKYAAAEESYRKGLDICRKALGEEHPSTAACYNNLAASLDAQGKYAAAEEGYRKALAIRRKVLGEEHPDTVNSYRNVASNLADRGQYAAAEEGFRTALAISRKVLGEEHPATAESYTGLAQVLTSQGKYAAAEEGFRTALAIRRKVLGEEHPETGASYNNLAVNLDAQGKYGAAEENHRKALDISRKVRGEEHPLTGISYHNLAFNLHNQRKYAVAEEGLAKALDICRKTHGEEHPDTATCCINLAGNLYSLGKYGAADESFRKALNIRRAVLGEEHPDTADGYSWMGFNLHARGRYAEAEEFWSRAAGSEAKARPRLTHSGLERATITTERSPLPRLAAVLARNGKTASAWQRYEESLARGTWDDLSARLRRPPAEQAQQAALAARLDRLDRLIEKVVTIKDETPQQKEQREDLLGQRRKAQDELDAFVAHLEKTYGPAAGQVFDIPRIQASLAADTALIGWIDRVPTGPKAADPNGEHWAFLLRHKGDPVCIRLKGTGDHDAWTEEDSHLPATVYNALQHPHSSWQRLAQRLRQQRVAPLQKYLAAHDGLPAVQHLIVLPSLALAGVPAEVFCDDHIVSYAHSGTLLAHLRSQPRVKTQGLFALADPVFQPAESRDKEPALPPGGVLITFVQPGSNAARSGLKVNDALLRYNGKVVEKPADVPSLIAAAGSGTGIAVTFWRAGRERSTEVEPGKLGIVVADKPAPAAIAERRRLDQRLASRSNDGDWQELPGTRVEVSALQRLFGSSPAPLLLVDSEASEQRLHALAADGTLGNYRYLHLATHGEVDNSFPLRSAVILSRDALPDPGKQLLEGKPIFDGRLTAEEVLRQWHLDAELVTLSACETALGKYEHGEGFVGFAQALLLCGSRSVCLSLWKVDDAATALLMQRFYANLLGKRQGLKAPMAKAAALREAKEWLRNLSQEEALKVAAEVSQGVERGKGRPKGKLLPPLPEPVPATKDDKPYAHPYYWAAFVLTGDPD